MVFNERQPATAIDTTRGWSVGGARVENRHQPSWPHLGQNIHNEARLADAARLTELFKAIEHLSRAVLASESHLKLTAFQELLKALMGEQGAGVLTAATLHSAEPISTSVVEVAGGKASKALEQYIEQTGQRVDPRILAIIRQFEQARILNTRDFEEIKKLMPVGTAFIGADVNFWTPDQDGSWRQHHKLERLNRELTDQEFLQLVERMEQYYCHPKSGRVQVMWDVGVVVLNGGVHEFHDQIEIIADPIDKWLFWQYMLEARATGRLYAYNPHFALIECLIAQGKIRSLATLSNEERQRGLTIEDKRMSPCPASLSNVERAIAANHPPRIPG